MCPEGYQQGEENTLSELVELNIDEIHDHPDNPSVKTGIWREDVIDAIAGQLEHEPYNQEHAVRVRPVNGHYQLVAGHHRKLAAKKAGLDKVWAWTREMDDDEAHMELALDNNHGEWGPLFYGIHVLDHVRPGQDGRGKKSGYREYARQIGRDNSTVLRWRDAAKVAKTGDTWHQFTDKTRQLAAISKADESLWPILCAALIENEWTVEETEAVVKKVGKLKDDIAYAWVDIFLPIDKMVEAIASGDKSPRALTLLATRAAVAHDKAKQISDKRAEEFKTWLQDNIGGESWDINALEAEHKKISLELTEHDQSLPEVTLARAEDWLQEQSPCDLLITDPPYMTDVDDINTFVASWVPLALDRVKQTGRAYICVGAYPLELRAYLNIETPDHIELRNVLVWHYKNTLGPQPTHNYIQNYQVILYYCGIDAPPLDCPELLEQISVHEWAHPARSKKRLHEWQKPDELADMVIRHASNQGDTVYDPFIGTGTFLAAAARAGRVARGCDIDAKMLKIAEARWING